MTLQERRQARAAAAQKEQRSNALQWLWVIPVLLIGGLIYAFSPRINQAMDNMQHPQPRADVVHIALLSNSKSDTTAKSAAVPDPKKLVADQAVALSDTLSARLGPVESTLVRFASRPVELYRGPNDPEMLLKTLKADYLDANPDPTPGTLLAPALEYGLKDVSSKALVVVSVGTDAWEDAGEVHGVLQQLRAQKRKVLVLVHGVPIHNVKIAKTQMDLRGAARHSLRSLGSDVCVASGSDFADAIDRWLPNKLRSQGIQLN